MKRLLLAPIILFTPLVCLADINMSLAKQLRDELLSHVDAAIEAQENKDFDIMCTQLRSAQNTLEAGWTYFRESNVYSYEGLVSIKRLIDSHDKTCRSFNY